MRVEVRAAEFRVPNLVDTLGFLLLVAHVVEPRWHWN